MLFLTCTLHDMFNSCSSKSAFYLYYHFELAKVRIWHVSWYLFWNLFENTITESWLFDYSFIVVENARSQRLYCNTLLVRFKTADILPFIVRPFLWNDMLFLTCTSKSAFYLYYHFELARVMNFEYKQVVEITAPDSWPWPVW